MNDKKKDENTSIGDGRIRQQTLSLGLEIVFGSLGKYGKISKDHSFELLLILG